MWKLKIKLKHDCIIGNRCEKFKVIDTGISFNVHKKNGKVYSPQIHTVYGDQESIKSFLKDLRKDKRVQNLEIEGNSFFCVEIRSEKVPSLFRTEKIVFVKPVFVDKEGFETWEIASWERDNLSDFVKNIERFNEVQILEFKPVKLTDVYYPKLAPELSPNQKIALNLAFEHGYYNYPRKTNLQKLAKLMKISPPTFFEHLRKAEKKIMPDFVKK